MRDILFRCSSLGHLMTEPRTRAEGDLSMGARSYIRQLVKEELFSVEFEVSSKETDKGIAVENTAIALLNKVRGLNLAKNTERNLDSQVSDAESDADDETGRAGKDEAVDEQ